MLTVDEKTITKISTTKPFYTQETKDYSKGIWKFKCCGTVLPWGGVSNKPTADICCPNCLDVIMVVNLAGKNTPLRLNGELITPGEYNELSVDTINELVPNNRNIVVTKVATINKKIITRTVLVDNVSDDEILDYVGKISIGHTMRYNNKTWSGEHREEIINRINSFVNSIYNYNILNSKLDQDMVDILQEDGRLLEFMNLTTVAHLRTSNKAYMAINHLVNKLKTSNRSLVDEQLLSYLT